MHSDKNIFITGIPGIGKTTIIKKLVSDLTAFHIGGFFTGEIRRMGLREGFHITTFDGWEKTLAHIHLNSSYRVGKYHVDIPALEEIVDHLTQITSSVELWIIDEIGKMESLSVKFRRFVEEILNDPVPVIATISFGGTGWIQKIRQENISTLFEVTDRNRDQLYLELQLMFQKRYPHIFS